ncbi:MAG: (Fe-S)-binding protein [Halobacteriota archaeon]|nr:(Fe-S)-binding protein [Halobacteriota archaeon]
MDDYAGDINKCSTCGFCRAYCPRFDIMRWDSFSPRGMVSIASGLSSGDIEMDEKLAERVYSCTLDGICEKTCPSSVKVTDIVLALKRKLLSSGFAFKDHEALTKSIKNYDNPWMQPRYSRSRWAKELEIKNLNEESADVLFFVGCTSSYDPSMRNIAISTANVLTKAGVDFGILGENEICCGSTLFGIGDKETYEECAKKNIEIFNSLDVDLVVTSCAGCYSIFKNKYPLIADMNFQVVSAVEYMTQLIREGRLRLRELSLKVTYHDPCHLGRHSGVFDAPREILRAIPGVELLEMQRNLGESSCCGAGGGVRTIFSEMAASIARRRVEEAKETGADVLVSACPFCYQNMRGLMKMYDISEIIDMAID